MTIKDLAEMLSSLGHDITLRKRSDGGYIISKIDGVSFKGASGNIRARQIAGVTLSHARSYQLARIRPQKKVAPMKRKLAPIPADIKKELRKAQREWRKTHKDVGGTISTRGVRYQLEHYGEEVVRQSLNKAYRYAQGFAYIENVQTMILRFQQDMWKLSDYEQASFERIITAIQNRTIRFKEEWINPIYNELYEFEKGVIDASELERRILSIIQ
jgi:hypothetical protein